MNSLTVGTPGAVPMANGTSTRGRSAAVSEVGESPDARVGGGGQPSRTQGDGQVADIGTLRDVVHKANAVIDAVGSGLRFRVDDNTGSVVVKVVDQSTGDVIRQIPSEEMLVLKQRLESLDSASRDQTGLIVAGKV